MVNGVRKAFKYLWDLKQKKIEAIFRETQHPYAKVQDKVDSNRVVGKRRIFPFGNKIV